MVHCDNCEKAGVYTPLIDRDTHFFCVFCGQRQEKVEPTVKQYRYAVDPWGTEVNY